MRRSGWPAFALWTVVGTLFALALVGVASIGVLVLPIAALAAVLAARSLRAGPELLGLLAGPAAVFLLIGFDQLGCSTTEGSLYMAPGSPGIVEVGYPRGSTDWGWILGEAGQAAMSVL